MRGSGYKISVFRRFCSNGGTSTTPFVLFHSEADAVQFFHYLNSRHTNIRFTMEKESENRLPFLDVLIDNSQVHVLTTVFRKSTFTGLLMNFTSFTSYSYKLGLIRTLIDTAYKINSTWLGFHQETTRIRDFLLKNFFPAHIIDKTVNSTISKFFQFNRQNGKNSPESSHVKLPYVGRFSAIAQKRIRRIIQRFCDNSLNIKLVFSSFRSQIMRCLQIQACRLRCLLCRRDFPTHFHAHK